jgi:hypothetical protein
MRFASNAATMNNGMPMIARGDALRRLRRPSRSRKLKDHLEYISHAFWRGESIVE